MGQELELLRRGQLRVERHQNPAAMKDSARGKMPLGLVRQEDGRAITSSETPALQKCGKGKRATAHFLERETDGLSTAVGFHKTNLACPSREGFFERLPQGGLFRGIYHGQTLSEPCVNALRQCAEIRGALHFIIGKLDLKVPLQSREKIERPSSCRSPASRRDRPLHAARPVPLRSGPRPGSRSRRSWTRAFAYSFGRKIGERIGAMREGAKRFLDDGRGKSSVKISISRSSSSRGEGLTNAFAAAAAERSSLVSWRAVARAMSSARPSAASCVTSPVS